MQPSIEPLLLPEGYGAAAEPLDWAPVRARLEQALHYWVATTRPDGRPHVVPRWGVWLDDSWYYDGSPDTRHARNLRDNPAAVLHLEDGRQAVVLEGESRPVTPDGSLGGRLAAAYRKYAELGYSPQPDQWAQGGLWRFVPSKALAWCAFPTDATRFTFSSNSREDS